MFSITEEKLREVIEDFDDWVWCNCNDCRSDCHSHAVNTEASKTVLADYIMENLNAKMDKRAVHLPQGAFIQSLHERCVYYVLPGALYEGKTMHGGWYFVDETESFGGGPYASEKDAIEELHKYAAWLIGDNNGTV